MHIILIVKGHSTVACQSGLRDLFDRLPSDATLTVIHVTMYDRPSPYQYRLVEAMRRVGVRSGYVRRYSGPPKNIVMFEAFVQHT